MQRTLQRLALIGWPTFFLRLQKAMLALSDSSGLSWGRVDDFAQLETHEAYLEGLKQSHGKNVFLGGDSLVFGS